MTYAGGIEQGISSAITQVNTLTDGIAKLNQQIAAGLASTGRRPTAHGSARPDVGSVEPVRSVSTATQSDGSMNVYVGSGQPWLSAQHRRSCKQLRTSTMPRKTRSPSSVAAASQPTSPRRFPVDNWRPAVSPRPGSASAENAVRTIQCGTGDPGQPGPGSRCRSDGCYRQTLFSVGGVISTGSAINTGTASVTATRTSLELPDHG